jgi:RimJ/RimL family protein N-acetyltransferase
VIDTERLVLRQWMQSDVAPFHAMGQDAEVMRYHGPRATWREARHARDRMNTVMARTGHCFWAIERRSDRRFIGFCGLMPTPAPIAGEVEIGWRLARGVWGRGYATEAAAASLSWAWTYLDVPSIAAVTVPANARSRRLIERLGMVRVAGGDFDHPDLDAGHPLRRHQLYRIARPGHD